MNTRRSSHTPIIVLFSAAILLLAACQPAVTATIQPPAQPTQPPVQPTQSSGGTQSGVTLDYSAVAQDVTVETVPAQPATPGGPYWEGTPEYRLLTLQGYPVATHLLKPQVFIYKVADLTPANAAMGTVASDLQSLLQSKQEGDQFPFLPISNQGQLIHAQVQYMNFKSGEGVRFLAQLGQGMTLINNNELIYTFQGLTGDGKYYIAAVLPVTNPGLPAGPDINGAQGTPVSNFRDYLSALVSDLNEQPGDGFTPSLLKLDDLIRSIEVR